MLVEQFDQLGEVGQRSGQPVDLVDHDDVDPAGLDIAQQALEGRPVQGTHPRSRRRHSVRDELPAFMGLALDIGLAGLPLGVERIELKIQIMLGGFAGVDRAADGWRSAVHAALSPRVRFLVLPFPQAKEPGPVPVGAGNDLGDGGEARIGLLLPDKAIRHDRHRVMRAPEFPDKDGPRFQPLAPRVACPLLVVTLQNLKSRLVMAAKRFFLKPPGQGSQQKIPPQPLWWLPAEFRTPCRPKLSDWQAGKAGDFGGYGFG